MSVIPHHRTLTRFPTSNHVPAFLGLGRRRLVVCSMTKSAKPKSSASQLKIEPQFVKKLSSPGPPVLNDPSMKSTWFHRTWVATGCTTVLVSLAKAIVGAAVSHIWLQPVLAGYIGYVLADLGSGVYHWGIDNYGDASTPAFGAQIEAFQGHHKWPWTITRRQFSNNLHALARAVTFFVLPIDLTCNDPTLLGFVSVCSGCIMFSQQFHAWSHGTKSKLPPLVVALQDAGVLVSRAKHATHHRPPFNLNTKPQSIVVCYRSANSILSHC